MSSIFYEYEGLHLIDILGWDDLENWLGNSSDPEQRKMIEYWIRLMNEKYGEPMPTWDDIIFLYAIGLEWLIEELKGRERLRNEVSNL